MSRLGRIRNLLHPPPAAAVEAEADEVEQAPEYLDRPSFWDARTGGSRPLPYCKPCELEDFQHPELRRAFDQVYAAAGEAQLCSPGREDRKPWEVCMTARAFADHQVLRPQAEVLGVGAGRERTIFYLTNHVRRVFATDLYLEPGDWATTTATPSFLVAPAAPPGVAWEPRRLVVQHMDALELRYPDASFDAVFSSSSIEHFGSTDDIRRSVDETVRVLRPGGIVSLSTELLVSRGSSPMPGTRLFTPEEIGELLIGGPDREPVGGGIWYGLSEATRAAATPHREALADIAAKRSSWSRYPHVVLTHERSAWVSFHVALRRR